MMRIFTSLAVLTLALGLAACGDDGMQPTTGSPTTNATPGTMSDGTTTDATTTDPTVTDGTTTSPVTDGTTTAPATDGTTTPATEATTTPDPTTTDGTTVADPTEGETTMGGNTTGPGEDLYGPCEMGDPPCPAGQLCLMVGDIDGNFCAPDCEGMGCPAVPAGVAATAMCVLTKPMEMEPTSCALICDPMAMENECPMGMTCKPVPMQPIGLCTAP
jgi:hypothetical protein